MGYNWAKKGMKKLFFNLLFIVGMAAGAMTLSSFAIPINRTSVSMTMSIPKGYKYVTDVTAYASVGAGEATVKRTLKLYEKEGDYILVISNDEWQPVNKNPLYGSDLDASWRNLYEYKAGKWFFNM